LTVRAALTWLPKILGHTSSEITKQHCRDAGAATFRHQHWQRRQRRKVADLVERQQRGRVEARSGRGSGVVPGDLDEVFDESRYQGP
jgi:hypothetical protein